MKRPQSTESTELAELGSGDSVHDALVEGARLAMSPPGDARHDLIDAAIARLEPRKRKLERPPERWEVAVAGLLVGLAMLAFLMGRMTVSGPESLAHCAVASVLGGGVVAAYLWNSARRR